MNIGIFTDTYYPQVSGVATSIKTLREQLEKQGHQVYIFTTTDPKVDKNVYERNIFRFTSIPFVSFTDRRIAVSGLFKAYQVAKELNLDIVHTQTEFSLGWIGKFVAKNLKIPCVHTYHTMYEDYLHYVANGHLLRPYHVKQATRAFCYHLTGVVAPSERVIKKLNTYGVKAPIRVIPTGVNVNHYAQHEEIDWRKKYGFSKEKKILLSLSRLAYEKNIQEVIKVFPKVLAKAPDSLLLIVGDGPARQSLEQQVRDLKISDYVKFAGEIDNDIVYRFYQMADLFVSASDSESQGLTYIEALAAGLKVVVKSSPYTDDLLDDPSLGVTFQTEKQFVHFIDNYLTHPASFEDPEPRERKLYDISADHFGKQIVSFYKDSMVLYADHEESSSFSD
ncbi:glycosyltransferase family 4 protein [Pediococcus cellicola]|uniref:Glycosyltransferase n=1 Tax=Pediococcus cellicola TaxID=319652 RepID=A0A0R2IMA6_9LACO|nr:glycosyltransferase family 4 protein [Pediococcus cellicola]KRN66111.1 glycosyltransferase [Pediococcus cellicola]GEL15416.1 1,2-diacylglycerol 3-glucosyltransferase [Pediococcus cellicola]